MIASSWTLCVGAGISFGLVPTWEELTRRVINTSFSSSYDADQFKELIAKIRWSLDALLQGAANRLKLDGKSSEIFGDLLEKELYRDLLIEANNNKVDQALIQALNYPRSMNKDNILSLCAFFQNKYGDSTLVQLSQEIANASDNDRGPRAIINFNADTLLYALLDIYLIKSFSNKTGKWQYPKASFVKTLRGIESREPNVTPIFHCHGSIAPKPNKKQKIKTQDSRDHLVFCEQDYLEIAGNVGTWAQSLFLFHSQCSQLLIIGHSLSDSNIRKWLNWSHENTIKELASISSSTEITPRHIWIARIPIDDKIREIQEISLLHLGIRVCWVKDWSEVGPTIRNLLAL